VRHGVGGGLVDQAAGGEALKRERALIGCGSSLATVWAKTQAAPRPCPPAPTMITS